MEQKPVPESSWLEVLARISPVGIFRTDAEGRCIYVNQRWCEFTGLSPAEAGGSGWLKAIHPDDRARIAEEWSQSAQTGANFRSEYRYLRPDGAVIWVFGETAEQRAGDGRLAGCVGVVTDVTELRDTRDRLEMSRDKMGARVRARTRQLEQMAMIVAESDDAIISTRPTGIVVSWNPAAEKLFGFTAEEMYGQSTLRLTPEDRLDESRELTARVRLGERIQHFETIWMTKSGQQIEVSLSVVPLRNAAGEVTGTSAIVRDISAEKRAERHLRQLSWRLLHLQDEERRRMARELHDSTAQTLAALAMNLSVLNQAGAQLAPGKRETLLADSLALTQSVVRELRTQSYLLHPPLLDERGLSAALHWFVEGFSARSEIAVDLYLDPNVGRLSETLETAIFRIVQESLTNVHRHSGSTTARIDVAEENGWITLAVRDRGRGLPAVPVEAVGVGIAGMKERVLELGGRFDITSTAEGTTVTAVLPMIL